MQLYEAQVDNEIRETQEYAVINNILRSQYEVDPKSVNGYAQAFAKALLKDQGYQDLKAKKQFKQVNETLNAYVKKRMDAIAAKRGQTQNAQEAQTETPQETPQEGQPAESPNTPQAEAKLINQRFLDILDNTSDIFKKISQDGKQIQSISLSDGGEIQYEYSQDATAEGTQPANAPNVQSAEPAVQAETQTKKTESIIEIPDFLLKYMEADESKATAESQPTAETASSDATPQNAEAKKTVLKNLNSFLREDIKECLDNHKWQVSKIYKGQNDLMLVTNAGEKSLTEIINEIQSLDKSAYDFSLSDQDVVEIEKEILRSLDMGKLSEALSKKVSLQGIPYDLKMVLGSVLKESSILNFKYRLKEYKPSIDNESKPKKFLVKFEATKKPEKENKKEDKKDSENIPKEENEKEPQITKFTELDDKSIVDFITSIKNGLLSAIKKYHPNGGLSFYKQKEISRDRSELGKALTGEDQKKNSYTVSMVVSGGEDAADYTFQKSDDKMTGGFSLSVSIGKVSKNWGANVRDAIDQIANATLSTDNSYTKF